MYLCPRTHISDTIEVANAGLPVSSVWGGLYGLPCVTSTASFVCWYFICKYINEYSALESNSKAKILNGIEIAQAKGVGYLAFNEACNTVRLVLTLFYDI